MSAASVASQERLSSYSHLTYMNVYICMETTSQGVLPNTGVTKRL
jgi:hypothetical protein